MNTDQSFLLTKIMATLGPATSEPETIERLITEGVRIFRVNFSHGTFDQHQSLVTRVRQCSDNLGIPVAVVGDLCGPKIRVGTVVEGGIALSHDQQVLFQREPIEAQPPASPEDPVILSSTFPAMIDEVEPGQRVLLDDSFVKLTCIERKEDCLVCRVLEGERISTGKGINLPDTPLSVPALTEKDRACVEFAVQHRFDYLALSFVRTGEDIRQLKQQLVDLGARPSSDLLVPDSPLLNSAIEIEADDIIPIITKIEKPQAIENLDDILRETDAVMVARGDLGVEMDLAEVAVLQKHIIQKCQHVGLPVIVATQMLQSMIESSTPTRAEVSDVANAIFDGADAVMLSGETAVGKHPIAAVRMMRRIAEKVNKHIYQTAPLSPTGPSLPIEQKRRAAALAHGVRTMACDLDVKLIVVWAQLSGGAVYLSQQRLPRPILVCSPSPAIRQRASLLYGVTPVAMEQPQSSHEFLQRLDNLLLDQKWTQEGDGIIVVSGLPITQVGLANQVSVHYVGEAL